MNQISAEAIHLWLRGDYPCRVDPETKHEDRTREEHNQGRPFQDCGSAQLPGDYGAASLIPGPSSTEVAIFIGQSKGGWKGLLVAGCCFIVPAAVLVTLIGIRDRNSNPIMNMIAPKPITPQA